MTNRKGLLLSLLTLIFALSVMAQKNNYDASWQKVDKLIKDNLPKSAMDEVDKIYTQSKKEGATAQNIKALVYKSRLVQQVEENDWFKNVQAFEKEAAVAKEPARQLLHSLAADVYWNYFQNKRYQIYDRTATTNFVKEDPETWTSEDFHRVIMQHYEQSLMNAPLLQKTQLDAFDPIIIKGNQRKLRPTLFDLLAHKAIDYFKTNEPEITSPAYQFQLNDMASLAPLKTFIRYQYQSADTSSHELFSIRIFQELLRFHANDADKAALVEADIERIQYAYSNSVHESKSQLYKEALEQVYAQYPNLPEAMKAGYMLGVWWRQKADNYNAATGVDADRFAYQQAALIFKEVIKKFPESEGGIFAANDLHNLNLPSLSLEVEKVNTIGEAFRALVKFKNTDAIYLRAIALTPALEDALNNRRNNEEDSYWKRITALPAIKNWQQKLPAFSDLRQHSAEIKIDGLPTGKYMVIASAEKDFSTGTNVMAVSSFYVSNISYISSDNQLFVLHRQTGKPLANASVQLWNFNYDYGQRKNIVQKGVLLKTDKNGFVTLPKTKVVVYSKITRFEITHNNDRLYVTDDQYYSRNYNPANENINRNDADLVKYFVFTDRSLYRPGQIVYFKAIGVLPHAANEGNRKGNSLYLSANPVTIELHNANDEIVDTLQLVANEFGSINGVFKLPETGLTGNFTLKVKVPQYSATSFNVEEYKRPKFFVEFDKLQGSYKLNDSITLVGNAKAYAGNNIDGAMVKYRVKRQTRFLYPWLFWRGGKTIWPPYNNEELEITFGEATTDADGKFTIRFKAIPDLSTDKALDPSFDYTVEADVTDINGETRSGSNTVSVGYKSMIVNLDVPGGLNQLLDSLKNISINTTNLAGEKVKASVAVNIYALQTPQRLVRERYWEAPDTTVMSFEEFVKNFPHDEYRNETDYHAWKKGKLVQTASINTANNQSITLDKAAFAAGYYVIEATSKDSAGNEIKAVDYIAITDAKKNLLPAPVYSASQAIKQTVEPGETATFMQGTAASDLFVVQQTSKAGKAFNEKPLRSFDFQQLDKAIAIKTFSATEADRGGYSVNRFFIKDNRVYTTSWNVNVPYSNKDLKIAFETFRDKLLPGQQETWKVKITGYKGEAVAAEMLASMYDASLDQLNPHAWENMNIWTGENLATNWNAKNNFAQVYSTDGVWHPFTSKGYKKDFDKLIEVGNNYQIRIRGMATMSANYSKGDVAMDMVMPSSPAMVTLPYGDNRLKETKFTPPVTVKDEEVKDDEKSSEGAGDKNKPAADNSTVQIRKNFNETAFFFPALHTSEDGSIEFSFTIPEALTHWKLQTLAHTKDLATAMATKTIVTQKQLMVQPNAPRFFRQGDSLVMVTKIVNLSDALMNGEAELQLIDPATLQPVSEAFNNKLAKQMFTVDKGKSVAISFPFNIPLTYTGALMYRIVAKAGSNSDGEEMALPVLTNRMLVTESFPINLRNTGSKQFTWNKLLQSGNSKSMQNQSLTVEYTSNPAWYAIQSLPYLMEYPYDCAEQTWSRFYANALATKIANSMPKIKAVFDSWKNTDTAALMSNLQKNQELKSILLEETPWVLQAKTEAEQKRNIGLLFDMLRMSNEASKAIGKLQELQSSNGGFVWFKGGPDDRYMTQYILTGIGHLKQLEAWPTLQSDALNAVIAKALPYLDARLKEDYDNLIKYKADLKKNNLSSIAIQWLYMRSFFDAPVAEASQAAYAYYRSQAKQFWTSQGKYEQGMIALALHRSKDGVTPKAILKSLTENSISNEEFGMYWKEFNNGGYYWWQAPVESHALLIEAYSEIENNTARVNDLKTWLLKQKQTQNWRSTKATAEACYALLLKGDNWLNNESTVSIKLGNETITPSKTEAGTGYFKQVIDGENITPSMGNITITSSVNKGASKISPSGGWGALYWQYFEDLDKITTAATPVSLKKQLFIQRNSDRGPVSTPVSDNDVLKVGDKVKVRIELRSDRSLEYIHLKDMRASCFEPTNVLSSYKYQDGLGYYEATRDASTNFFISYMPKGTYIFEYEMMVTHTGNFSNGISSIQCMYAPEFSSHSEGIRVTVK